MTTRSAILALVPALMAVPAIASESVPGVREYTLDNGMQVLVREDRRAPVVVPGLVPGGFQLRNPWSDRDFAFP